MSPVPAADPAFRHRVLSVHGEAARGWLDDLPGIVERWRRTWDLGPVRPYPLSYNWVAAADRADGRRCVLKLAPPGLGVLDDEARWLRLADGRGAARLHDAAPADGALLLERIEPGTLLADLAPARDDDACDAIAAVIAGFQRPEHAADPAFAAMPTLRERLADLDVHRAAHDGHDPLPGAVVATATRVAGQLLDSARPDVLLHGDLHHDNVLLDQRRGWLAIDPHGLRGDATYEPSALLYNPLPLGPQVARLAERRCRRLAAATGFAEERIRGWGYVQAVLSAVWSLDEDPEPDAHVLAVADALAP